jgi:hypothetical protein
MFPIKNDGNAGQLVSGGYKTAKTPSHRRLIRVPDNWTALERGVERMVKVIYEGDDFKRMLRTDLQKLERLVEAKKFGVFEVDYKEGKIKVEIKKKGTDIVVKRWRPT